LAHKTGLWCRRAFGRTTLANESCMSTARSRCHAHTDVNAWHTLWWTVLLLFGAIESSCVSRSAFKAGSMDEATRRAAFVRLQTNWLEPVPLTGVPLTGTSGWIPNPRGISAAFFSSTGDFAAWCNYRFTGKACTIITVERVDGTDRRRVPGIAQSVRALGISADGKQIALQGRYSRASSTLSRPLPTWSQATSELPKVFGNAPKAAPPARWRYSRTPLRCGQT
jgi:hypothetical protein